MDWFKLFPSALLADVRRHRLSLEAVGLLVQACSLVALYDGDFDAEDLRQSLRPIPSPRRFRMLIAQIEPVMNTYLSDVQTQAIAYRTKSQKASRSVALRWERQRNAQSRGSASADTFVCTNVRTDEHTERKKDRKIPPTPKGDVLDHAFHRFWAAYPRHTGKARAQKVWERLAPSDQLVAAMLDAIRWQSQQPQWLKDGGQFVPHPSTWLSQRRWEDEPVCTQSEPEPALPKWKPGVRSVVAR